MRNHIRPLDCIRGIAVLCVVLFHLGMLQPGWVGVQIFFVLSGYLITSILLAERHKPLGQYLGRFYWRRSLRIFPLYLFFLTLAALCYWTLKVPASFSRDWPWLVTYTANFARMRETDIGSTFVHLWSLGVEEQFYLIWPLVVYALSPAAFRMVIIALIITCPLARLGFYLAFQGANQDWLGRTIYGLPAFQFDAFAVGAAIAIWPIKNSGKWFASSLVVTAACGAAVIAHQYLAFHAARKWTFGYAMYLQADYGFVWGYTLINITSALFIAYAINSSVKLLQNKALVRVGVISYGVYIYHLPLLLCLQQLQMSKFLLLPIYLAFVYAVAEISYRFLESPFLALKDKSKQWVGTALIESPVGPSKMGSQRASTASFATNDAEPFETEATTRPASATASNHRMAMSR